MPVIPAAAFRRLAAAYPTQLRAASSPSNNAVLLRFAAQFERKWNGSDRRRLDALRRDRRALHDPALERGDEVDLLRLRHENDFSNWLAWLASESNAEASVLQREFLCVLLGSRRSLPLCRVEREVVVAAGHDESGGRLDLLVRSARARLVVVVENKTRTPTIEELQKHAGYVRSIRRRWPSPVWRHRFILLVPDPTEVEPHTTYGFEVVGWEHLARALRRLLARRAVSRSRALAALFLSAVEGNVLGFPVALWRRFLLDPRRVDAVGIRAICGSPYLEYLEGCYAQE